MRFLIGHTSLNTFRRRVYFDSSKGSMLIHKPLGSGGDFLLSTLARNISAKIPSAFHIGAPRASYNFTPTVKVAHEEATALTFFDTIEKMLEQDSQSSIFLSFHELYSQERSEEFQNRIEKIMLLGLAHENFFIIAGIETLFIEREEWLKFFPQKMTVGWRTLSEETSLIMSIPKLAIDEPPAGFFALEHANKIRAGTSYFFLNHHKRKKFGY